MSRNFATTQCDEDAKVRNWGKNLIYHLLNKNFRKFVKVLLNKIKVNQTIKLLPSKNPDLHPLAFQMTYHCFCTGNKYLTLGKEYILREITFVKSESLGKQINNFVQN